jgi:hypothetical protein
VPHLLLKYVGKQYDAAELQRGQHGWRARLAEEKIKLPLQAALHTYTSDDQLDLSRPRMRHVTEDWALPKYGGKPATSEETKSRAQRLQQRVKKLEIDLAREHQKRIQLNSQIRDLQSSRLWWFRSKLDRIRSKVSAK